MTAIQIIGFIGILLIIGFLADYLFRKTRFPDILILIALGYLIGPVFHIINPSEIAPASQIIASLALVVILFNGGLDLEFAKVLSSAPRALFLVFTGIVLSVASTAAFVYYLMHWGFMDSLLLGVIVGGTSPSIVLPLISRAKVPGDISSILSLESAFNGALVIVVALGVNSHGGRNLRRHTNPGYCLFTLLYCGEHGWKRSNFCTHFWLNVRKWCASCQIFRDQEDGCYTRIDEEVPLPDVFPDKNLLLCLSRIDDNVYSTQPNSSRCSNIAFTPLSKIYCSASQFYT